MKSTSTSNTTSTTSTAEQVYAVINTTQGVMEAQLFPSVAPKTVANFVNLANSGFYNDLVWHRIVAGFIIQTGDPTTKNGGGNEATWGNTGSTTTVPLETNSSDVAQGYVNNEGYLGMARVGSDFNSGSSQFFINLANNPSLNGQYTSFWKIDRWFERCNSHRKPACKFCVPIQWRFNVPANQSKSSTRS